MQKPFPIHIDEAVIPVIVDTVPNPEGTPKLVQIIDPEFSSVCPKTGLPDYGRVILRYIPRDKCVELKAWKLFLRAFYGVGIFHEGATQKIIETFITSVAPQWCNVTIDWGARGGLHTTTSMNWSSAIGYTAVIDDFLNEVMAKHSKNWHNM